MYILTEDPRRILNLTFIEKSIVCLGKKNPFQFEVLTYNNSEGGLWVATLNTFKKYYILINNVKYKEIREV